jgi:hypothetical protein
MGPEDADAVEELASPMERAVDDLTDPQQSAQEGRQRTAALVPR